MGIDVDHRRLDFFSPFFLFQTAGTKSFTFLNCRNQSSIMLSSVASVSEGFIFWYFLFIFTNIKTFSNLITLKSTVVCPTLIFTESAPLGRFSHRVAMSVRLSVCLCHQVQFFLGLSLALRSYDQFQASIGPTSLPPLETWKLGNLETWILGNLETRKPQPGFFYSEVTSL